MNMYGLLLAKKLSGGGGGGSTLVSKTITANGTYNPSDDNADGYSVVVANVPNTYTLSDEGKVVDSGALVAQTAKNIDANGLYDTTLNNSVSVDVPNTYTAGDEGKVVSSGALVSQSSRNIDANGTYDTTLNNSVDVSVPNSYTVADEGKVVSSGTLVSQTAYPTEITANNTYDTTLYNSVTVNVPTGGGGDDVIFYDYDGTELYKYSKNDFLALTEMPANPTHTGLTAQGWNWSLTDAKTYVGTYGGLNIGQFYVTDDGKTRIYVHLPPQVVGVTLYTTIAIINGSVSVDWGDGTTDTITGVNQTINASHIYNTYGDVVITFGSSDSKYRLYGNDNLTGTRILYCDNNTLFAQLRDEIYKIEMGTNTGFYYGACAGLKNLRSISVGSDTDADGGQRSYTFAQTGLKHITISPNMYVLGYMFYNAYLLHSISLSSTVRGNNVGQYAFSSTYSLEKLYIPVGVTTIPLSMCSYCYMLHKIVIPSTVTSFGNNVFENTYNLGLVDLSHLSLSSIPAAMFKNSLVTSVNFPLTISSIGNEAFYNCPLITSVTIPNGVTSIGISTFAQCYSLTDVSIPNSVTSIGNNVFSSCSSLTVINIPSSVTSISSSAFTGTQLVIIDIDKPTDSISGAPWGAPSDVQIIWHD